MSHRWILPFLIAALLLPPLPVAIGGAAPHPALLLAGAGLFAGLLSLRSWHVPADNLSRALLFFFFILLFSAAPALIYNGLEVGLAALARVALFGLSVYLFLYLTAGPAKHVSRRFPILDGSSVLRRMRGGPLRDRGFRSPVRPPAGFSDQYVWLDTGAYRRAQGLFYDASTLGNFLRVLPGHDRGGAYAAVRERPVSRFALMRGGAAVLRRTRSSLTLVRSIREPAGWRARPCWRCITGESFGPLALGAGCRHARLTFAAPFVRLYLQRLAQSRRYFFSRLRYHPFRPRVELARSARFPGGESRHALIGIGYKTLPPYSDFTGGKVIADNMYLSLLVETGVVGLAALLCAARRHSARWRGAPALAFSATWIFCFWCGEIAQMLSGDLFTYWRVLPLYFWVLAAAVRPG